MKLIVSQEQVIQALARTIANSLASSSWDVLLDIAEYGFKGIREDDFTLEEIVQNYDMYKQYESQKLELKGHTLILTVENGLNLTIDIKKLNIKVEEIHMTLREFRNENLKMWDEDKAILIVAHDHKILDIYRDKLYMENVNPLTYYGDIVVADFVKQMINALHSLD